MSIDFNTLFTWGRVAFVGVMCLAGAATFVAGQIAGANELEPRVTALERRADVVENKLSQQGEDIAEIKGYVRAIAGRLGVSP